MNVEELIAFITRKGRIFTRLSFTTSKSLETIVKELEKVKIITSETEYHRESHKSYTTHYKLGNIKVLELFHDKHETYNDIKCSQQNTSLICRAYDDYKNNGYSSEAELKDIQYDINLEYSTVD